jgi:hypothetical protein
MISWLCSFLDLWRGNTSCDKTVHFMAGMRKEEEGARVPSRAFPNNQKTSHWALALKDSILPNRATG